MLLVEATAVGAIVWFAVASRRANQKQITFKLGPNVLWIDNVAKPTVKPPVFKAAAAKILPGELVVGVEFGGKARAYRALAFDDTSGHLVNDMIGSLPVSVACCNISSTVRVYTDSSGSQLLDAEVLGLLNNQMVIRLGKHLYFHSTGSPVEPDKNPPPIPYQRVTPVVTTWQDWSKRYPDSDVFVGGR